jgi:hypothetical protein
MGCSTSRPAARVVGLIEEPPRLTRKCCARTIPLGKVLVRSADQHLDMDALR